MIVHGHHKFTLEHVREYYSESYIKNTKKTSTINGGS